MAGPRMNGRGIWLAAAVIWLGAVDAQRLSATTPTPLRSCCDGTACCGGSVDGAGAPCQLAYGASGTVTDARTGAPLARARVTVAGIETLSNDDGSYGAFGSRPDTCQLDYDVPVLAEADGYAPFSDAPYTSVPLRQLDIRLEPLDAGTGHTISGVVTESPPCDGGVDGVTVVLEPLGRRTESATVGLSPGFYAFTNVPPGEYTVRTEPACTLDGCWAPRPVTVSTFDVGASFCPTLRADVARLDIADVTGAPGATVPVDVALHTGGVAPARVTATIDFAPEARIAVAAAGGPDCEPVAAVEAASFGWLPVGCAAGVDCAAVRAEVQIGAAVVADDAVLFRCQAAITDQPADTCSHQLRCRDLTLTAAGGAPLDAMCAHGSVTSRTPQAGLGFAVAVTPDQPVVGDSVEVRVTVNGRGGIPSFRLLGAEPLLSGETSVAGSGPVSQTVTFRLTAVGSGAASLQLSVNYESEIGCPGSVFYGFVGDVSAPYALVIAAGDAPTPTPTPTPTAPVAASPTADRDRAGGGGCAIQAPPGVDGDRGWLTLIAAVLVLAGAGRARRGSTARPAPASERRRRGRGRRVPGDR